ncbi:MAG TPA: hypothetical protein VGW74_01345, partial [Propionibacteriaceae bacterium]|nr:hypothetical protein [Propionibacteriaceae bacterium]
HCAGADGLLRGCAARRNNPDANPSGRIGDAAGQRITFRQRLGSSRHGHAPEVHTYDQPGGDPAADHGGARVLSHS